jgi:hypothetical protein
MADETSDFISNLTNKDYIFQNNSLQKEIKINIDLIIDYIQKTIIPNSMLDYSEHVESEEDIEEFQKVKEMFINEGIEIVNKLSTIIMKHQQVRPYEYVNLDTTLSWYLNEKTFTENEEIKNPFFSHKIVSKILTIIFKLIDFINEQYLNEINWHNRRIKYIEKLLKDKKEELSEMEFIFYSMHLNIKLKNEKEIKEKVIDNFKNFHEINYPIRSYFLSLFKIDSKEAYLRYLPICSLNIFRSSLYFIKEDIEFLDFMIKFEDWIPSSYRCIYLLQIIKLFQNSDTEIKKHISRFNPDINLLIYDLISLYDKLTKDPSVISDLSLINSVLVRIFDRKRFYLTIPIDKLISFVSIELTIISKLKSEKENIPKKDYEQLIEEALICIQHVITYQLEITENYLVHQIISILLSFYDETYDNYLIKTTLDIIFSNIINNKYTIIYLCSMLEKEDIINIKIPLTQENKDKLMKWMNIYKSLNTNYDLIDPITSCVIVIPCVIPMDLTGSMTQICDKNMLMSYLWDKAENPFTRSPLTIADLDEFNKKEESIIKLKEFKAVLKEEIIKAKNDNDK